MHYGELQYQLDDRGPDRAAALALRVLADIAVSDAGALAYFLHHSNMLVLAGLRAIGPYMEFSPLFPQERFDSLAAVLSQHGLYLVAEGFRYKLEQDWTHLFALQRGGAA
ncbi:hypothetical protein [Geodermatophilus sp. URMC 65]